jgi:hypothetical protein
MNTLAFVLWVGCMHVSETRGVFVQKLPTSGWGVGGGVGI